jgi:hypothetical protein
MKYFLGFLATVALVIVVFILVIRGFTSNRTPKDAFVLADHTNSSMSVVLTVDGRVNADQDHQGYRILIDRNEAKLETYKGYQNQITDSKTYANNTEAYGTFLRALDLAGFSKGDDESKQTDERGVCANGTRYIYEIKDGPKGDKRYWATSCGGGTFKGKDQTVQQLFERQIPDFSPMTSRLDL